MGKGGEEKRRERREGERKKRENRRYREGVGLGMVKSVGVE